MFSFIHRDFTDLWSVTVTVVTVGGEFKEVEGSAEFPITTMGDMSSQETGCVSMLVELLEDNALHQQTVSRLKCYI